MIKIKTVDKEFECLISSITFDLCFWLPKISSGITTQSRASESTVKKETIFKHRRQSLKNSEPRV